MLGSDAASSDSRAATAGSRLVRVECCVSVLDASTPPSASERSDWRIPGCCIDNGQLCCDARPDA